MCRIEIPELLYYTHIPILFLGLFIGFFILFSDRKNETNKNLFIFIMFFCWWTVNDILQWVITDLKYSVFFQRVAIIESLAMLFFLYFSYSFVNKKLSIKKKLLIFAPFIPVFVLLFSDFNLKVVDAGTCLTESGGLYWYVYALSIICAAWSVSLFLYKTRNLVEKSKKDATRIIIWAIIFFVFWFLLSILLLNYYNNDEISQVVPLGMIIFVGMIAYAITEYKFLNLKLIKAQALTYSVWMAIGSMYFFSSSTLNTLLITLTLLLAVWFGAMLIKSVKLEIKQREEVERANKTIEKQNDELAIANEKLKQLDQAKSDFFARASHDLRTPITGIRGFVSLLEEGSYGEVNEQQKSVLEKTSTVAKNMLTLVEDFLTAAKLDAGGMQYDFAKTKVDEICKQIVDTLFPKSKDKGLTLEFKKSTGELPEVTVDASRIRESVSNLVDNAIKYTEKGGVTVQAERAESSNYVPVATNDPDEKILGKIVGSVIRITISDTGIGIPKDELPRLFARFSRGKDTKRLKSAGTGLGLYVGKCMIQDNGGRIWAESDGDGKGSRFIVELPIEPPKEILDKMEKQKKSTI